MALNQQASNSGIGSSLGVTFPAKTITGNVVIVAVVASQSVTGVSGAGAGALTLVQSSSTNRQVSIWQGTVGAIGGTVLTVSLSASGTVLAVASEWSFVTAVDVQAFTNGSASPITSPSVTPGTTPVFDVIIAVGGDTGAMTPGAPTSASGFTSFALPTQQAAAKIECAYRIVTSAGSFNCVWTDTGANGWDAVIVGFSEQPSVLQRNQVFIAYGDPNEVILEAMPFEWPLNLWEILELHFTEETGWGSLHDYSPVQPASGNVTRLRALYNGSHGTVEKGLKGNVVQVVQGTGHSPFTVKDWRGNTGTYVFQPDTGLDVLEIHGAAASMFGQGFYQGTLRLVKIT